MTKHMAGLVLYFLVSNAYADPALVEDCDLEPESTSTGSFFSAIFKKSASTEVSGCEPLARGTTEPDVLTSVDSERDTAIRVLIEEGRAELEQTLEEYRTETSEEINRLRQAVNSLREESVELKGKVKASDASYDKKIAELGEQEVNNRALVETNNQEIKLIVDRLNKELDQVSSALQKAENDLDGKVESSRRETNKSVDELNRVVGDNGRYLAASILVVLLISSLIFYWLRRKISVQSLDLTGSLLDTRKSLEEEFVKIDMKLVEIFESNLQGAASNADSVEVDHSLVIKVADELVRIQKNISGMDGKTKGLKQLSASVTRIQANVASNGYEIVEMLGMQYDEGMKVTASFVIDEGLEEGEQVVTRIIKPQINYEGVMIQSAQIEVSLGE